MTYTVVVRVVEECRGTYLCATEQEDAQHVGLFPLERSPDEDVMHTIRFGTPRFGGQVDHRIGREFSFITLQHCTLTQGTSISSLDDLFTRNKTQEVHLRWLDETWCIGREAFLWWHMVEMLVGRCRLGDDLIFYRVSTCSSF